jgi:hypothetical protein
MNLVPENTAVHEAEHALHLVAGYLYFLLAGGDLIMTVLAVVLAVSVVQDRGTPVAACQVTALVPVRPGPAMVGSGSLVPNEPGYLPRPAVARGSGLNDAYGLPRRTRAGSGISLPPEIPGAVPCAYCAAGPAWFVPLMFLSSSWARAARALSSFMVSRKNCAMSFSPAFSASRTYWP